MVRPPRWVPAPSSSMAGSGRPVPTSVGRGGQAMASRLPGVIPVTRARTETSTSPLTPLQPSGRAALDSRAADGSHPPVGTAAVIVPPGLVSACTVTSPFGVVTPPPQARLGGPATQRTLKFTPLNAGAAGAVDRSLTKAPAAPRQARKAVLPKPKRTLKKAPAKGGSARAKRALSVDKAVAVEPPPRPRSAGSSARPIGPAAVPATGDLHTSIVDKAQVITLKDLNRALLEGMRPVCAQLATLSKQLGDVSASVGRISTSMHSQGVGNERTANAVVQLQGTVEGVVNGVVSRVKSEHGGRRAGGSTTADPTDEDERLELATLNEDEVRRVRDVAKQMMVSDITSAVEGLYVMPSGARVLDICYQATEHVLHVDRAGAQEYMESRRLFINADGKPADRRAPVSEKLNRVKGHLLEAMRKVAMMAYFHSLGIDVAELTPVVARGWLEKEQYAKSPPAKTATNAALKALFVRSGQSGRVVAAAVGKSEYVNASMGHVALIAHWACVSFQKAVGTRKVRRTGNDDGSYAGWREHMILVNKFLRHHTDAEEGLQLCDGDDERRALLVADDGTYTVDADTDDGGPDEVVADDGVSRGAGGRVAGGDGGGAAGSFAADGDVAGGDVAGGDVAGGDVAGGDVVGGPLAGGDVAGGDVVSGRVAGGGGGPSAGSGGGACDGGVEDGPGYGADASNGSVAGDPEAPQPDADADWVQPHYDDTALLGSMGEVLEEEEFL